MTLTSFTTSLSSNTLPEDLNICLRSLWYDAKGDWHKAHDLINDLEDTTAAWVHAYLHRKEGDPGNAGYRYRRAGKKVSTESLENEWKEIVTVLLNNG